MDKHTPGPWTYTKKDNRGWHSIRSSDSRTVAEIICQLPWEAESNARLIAAAPEMLRLLHQILWEGSYDDEGDFYLLHQAGVRPEDDYLDPEPIAATRALLAKIEGK